MHGCGSDVGESNGRAMEGMDEELPVLVENFGRHIRGGLSSKQLLLEDNDHILNVAVRDEIHRQSECLSSDVHVGTRKRPKHVHQQLLHYLDVVLTQLGEAIEENELDVVVGLRREQLAEALRSCSDRRWSIRKRNQCVGGFVHDGGCRALEQRKNYSDVNALLHGVRPTDFSDELECRKLQSFSPRRNLLNVLVEVEHGTFHITVTEHDECVAPARKVDFILQKRFNDLGCIWNQVLKLCENLISKTQKSNGPQTHERMQWSRSTR